MEQAKGEGLDGMVVPSKIDETTVEPATEPGN